MTKSAPPAASHVITTAEYVAASRTGELPAPVGVEVAFAGRSNVGKSTLLNTLASRKSLVRTSSTPGCTRQVTLFALSLKDGPRLTFADLPGYGFAHRSKAEIKEWAMMIEDYLLGRSTLGVVALLVDSRRGLDPRDGDLLELVRDEPRVSRAPLGLVTIATKLDKLPVPQRKSMLADLRKATDTPVIGFSARMPETRDAVWNALLKAGGFSEQAGE